MMLDTLTRMGLARLITLSSLVMLHLPAAIAQAGPPQAAMSTRWRYYPERALPPKGAPNILLIMTDDVGFGATSTFGGPIPTPTFDALADRGLRYNTFHTTAMCSPSRAALLTGRNHHAVGYGAISNVSLDEPGYISVIPKSAATVGRVLRDAGYDTAWFGKNHNTPEWELGAMGPFDHWPNAMGFDYFYGFNAAMTDQRSPTLTENRNAIQPPNTPEYFLDRDLADRMIHWINIQHTADARRPFFAYLAPGTMHSPQQAPADWIARFRGKFDAGWDKQREQIFARQKAMGVIPANAILSPRPADIPAWDSLGADQRRLYIRMMETAAAQLSYMDFQLGRVIENLWRSGQLDNTLILFVQGDNGSSLETFFGITNEGLAFSNSFPSVAEMMPDLDKIGSRDTAGQYPAGWGWALNTPFPWGKQIASHLGGLRDGLVISWPDRIQQTGTIRSQFHHLIDIAPTIYEATGIKPPAMVDGVEQQPIDGVSMVYTFDNPSAPTHRREQYFEMLGNRGYYKDGWWAGTTPAAGPWKFTKADPNQFPWELYDLNTDYAQTANLAGRNPGKLEELRRDFDAAATRYHVLPLSSDLLGRAIDHSLRPGVLPSSGKFTYYPGDTRYSVMAWPSIAPGWTSVSTVDLKSKRDNGPIFGQGGRFGSMSLTLDDGKPVFVYDPTARDRERVVLNGVPLSPGKHELTIRFSGSKAPYRVTLFADGREVDSKEVGRLIRVRGEAFVGRTLLDAPLPSEPCECAVESVVITK
ncbi:arylsulfatase [Massilia cavernae]|uniref:Arylsulfatase n=1 Tax=Massilia cavernae TaxID=2320864 RepID=A0A418XGN3_9BURK|nr:arylsulfatase [Massilia cavernae]RJG11622.1 arylsulfatase [Massilia cavernae]